MNFAVGRGRTKTYIQGQRNFAWGHYGVNISIMKILPPGDRDVFNDLRWKSNANHYTTGPWIIAWGGDEGTFINKILLG